MYAESQFSPPKLDYPYQQQQQLSGGTSSAKKEQTQQFSAEDNKKIQEALSKSAA